MNEVSEALGIVFGQRQSISNFAGKSIKVPNTGQMIRYYKYVLDVNLQDETLDDMVKWFENLDFSTWLEIGEY